MRYLTPTEQDWFAFQREFVLESDVDFSPPSLVIQFIELQSFWINKLNLLDSWFPAISYWFPRLSCVLVQVLQIMLHNVIKFVRLFIFIPGSPPQESRFPPCLLPYTFCPVHDRVSLPLPLPQLARNAESISQTTFTTECPSFSERLI